MTGLESLRQYEREHLHELEGTAKTQDEMLVELYKPKSERIKKYAETLAERIDQKDPMLDIQEKDQISTYIRRKYREIGIAESVIAHIGRELPDEYKNLNLQREVVLEENGHQMVSDSKPPEKMDNLELQTFIEEKIKKEKTQKAELTKTRDDIEFGVEEAKKRNLHIEGMRSEQITTQKPEAGQSLTWIAMNKHIETLQGVRDTIYEFPPKPEDDGVFAQAIDDYDRVFKPFADLKWAKSFPAWLDVQLFNKDHGKHGAGSKKGAVFLDDGSKRIITRERVGDSEYEILENAKKVLQAIPIIGALVTWHRENVEKPVAERRKNLGPILSEKA